MSQVCCRLFERRSHPPLPLKRMSMVQVEDFRTHGYVVMDGMLTKEAAGRIKAEALRLAQKGESGVLDCRVCDQAMRICPPCNQKKNKVEAQGAVLVVGETDSCTAC